MFEKVIADLERKLRNSRGLDQADLDKAKADAATEESRLKEAVRAAIADARTITDAAATKYAPDVRILIHDALVAAEKAVLAALVSGKAATQPKAGRTP
jgi:Tfp pilus assembly protein PilN